MTLSTDISTTPKMEYSYKGSIRFILGGLASVLVMGILRNNSIPAHIAAWFIGAFFVLAFDCTVGTILSRLTMKSSMIRTVLALVLGAYVGSFFALTNDAAFNMAFGMSPPGEIKELVVAGHHSRGLPGGIADKTILLQFVADKQALQHIVSKRKFKRNKDKEQSWGNSNIQSNELLLENQKRIWRSLFGLYDPRSETMWNNIMIPTRVEIYYWGRPTHCTWLLWEVDTGKVYALYMLG